MLIQWVTFLMQIIILRINYLKLELQITMFIRKRLKQSELFMFFKYSWGYIDVNYLLNIQNQMDAKSLSARIGC